MQYMQELFLLCKWFKHIFYTIDVYLHRKVSQQSNYLKTWRSRAFRRKSSESNRTEVLQETYVTGQAFTGNFFNLLTNQTTGCQLVVSQW